MTEQEQVGPPVPPLPSPPSRPSGTELGRLGGMGAQFYLWWWSLRLLGVKVGSLSSAGFLMPFPASVALE